MTKKKIQKIISKKDIVIPKGTVFECIDGSSTQYYFNNFRNYIEINKDNSASFVICYDEGTEDDEYFEFLED